MVRCYNEVYSKGNECFLRSEVRTRNSNIDNEVRYLQNYASEAEETISILVKTDYYAVVKIESEDFIEIRTISYI